MGEASERLALAADGRGKDLADETPDHGTLAERVADDEQPKEPHERTGGLARGKYPSGAAKAGPAADRSPEEQRTAAHAVDDNHADHGGDEVRDAKDHRLQGARIPAETRHDED